MEMLTTAINYGQVIDTRRKEKVQLNVGIREGKIVELSQTPLQAEQVIDASGLIVAPGFIDVHGHIDGNLYAGRLSACQGVTTTIGGNCGYCPVDMREFFEGQEKNGFPIHQAMLIGHGVPIRERVGLLDPYEPASEKQIEDMVRLADQALRDGACGVSFGLDYVPGCSIEEVMALAKISAAYGRICPIHTRLLTNTDLYSLFELFIVAAKTNAHILISHFVYQYCNGLVPKALAMVDKARKGGLKIDIDSGMYTNWSTYLDTTTFDYQTIVNNHWTWDQMVVATGQFKGRVLDEQLYHYMRSHCPHEAMIFFEGKEQEVYDCLVKNYAMPSSDIGAYEKGEGHPQIAGTFPRFFRKMVREKGLLTLEEAVYKATLFPAETFGFAGKGVIEPGMDADIVVFDIDSICDKADYPHLGLPDAAPEGIPYVMVNGTWVVEDGIYTDSRSGRIIRK